MQVESFLEEIASRWPDKTALVASVRRWTYAELETACNRLAAALVAQGVERGDRVAVHLENSVEAVVAVFAALKAGAVFLMVNPTTKADKLVYILNNSRAKVLVLPERKLGALETSWELTPHLEHVIVTSGNIQTVCSDAVRSAPVCSDPIHRVGEGRPDSKPHECGYYERTGNFANVPPKRSFHRLEDLLARHARDTSPPAKRAIDVDLAALVYTSGSTGNPKGVMLTHLNMVSAATSITTYLENTADDIILNVLPLSFDYGLYQVLMGLKIGGTVVLERSFTYPHAVMEKLVLEKVTGLPLVPTMSAILLQMDLSKYDLSCLRYVTNTGAALPTDHTLRLREQLPHVRIYSMYGLTECKRVSYLPPEQIDFRPTSVGRGMPNEEVYIVDGDGRRVGPGVVGELVVRGSNVMKGYWELPEETERRLKPGPLPGENVLYTGDLFRMDEEGYLYFVGRKDDIIKSRGEKVSPKEVENVLYSHPDVAEAAVIGVPDEILGQAIHAVVTLKEGTSLMEKELLAHCRDRLEDFMVPQHVEFLAAMPKTSNGKIDKRELCDMLLAPSCS